MRINLNIIKLTTAILFAVVSIPLSAQNRLTLSNVSGDARSTQIVRVSLENDVSLSGLQLLLDIPPGSCEVTTTSVATSGRAENMFSSVGYKDGKISLMLYSTSKATIAAGSGEIATFEIVMGEDPLDLRVTPVVKATDASGNVVTTQAEEFGMKCLKAKLEIPEKMIDFGRVPLNQSPVKYVTLMNAGTSPLEINAVTFSKSVFSVATSLPLNIAAGGSAQLEVRFAPEERGELTANMAIDCNSRDTYNALTLKATPFSVNELHIGDVSGESDSEVTIPLSINNMDAINGFTVEMTLPSQLEYVENSFKLNERASALTLSATCSDNKLRATAYSLKNETLQGNGGEVASFRVRLSGRSSCELKTDKAVLSAIYRGEVTDVLSASYPGNVSINYPLISVDSELSLGRTPVPEKAIATLDIRNYGNSPLVVSRVESDSELIKVDTQLPITVAPWESVPVAVSCEGTYEGDLAGILNVYSNDPDQRLVKVNCSGTRYACNELSFSAEETPAYTGILNLKVNLSNYDTVSGLQFDITYPASHFVALDDIETVGRCEGMTVDRRNISEGVDRFFCYSMSGKSIDSGDDTILVIPFEILDENKTGTINVKVSEINIGTPALENKNSTLGDISFDVTLTDWLRGDADCNGVVDSNDAVAATNHYMGTYVVQKFKNADINEDSIIDAQDSAAICNIYLTAKRSGKKQRNNK